MRLGVIYDPTLASAYYRALFPMRALELLGHTVVWPSRAHQVPREFFGCDLVHCFRRADRLGDLRKLSARGVAISFDNDDNFAAAEITDRASGMGELRLYKATFRDLLKVARLADVTTTPSGLLAQRYRVEGARNVVVIENHLERSMFGFGSRSKHEGVLVGYVAGREHSLDLDRIPIADVLRRLLEVHRDLRVLTVGVPLALQSSRYEHIREVPFVDLLKVASRIDIGIAPLADTVFNRSRSNVKLKEYASGGAAWLASPVGPYRGLGEDQGGMLVEDGDWMSAIDLLIRDRRRRRRLCKHARAWAQAQALDRHIHAWESAFQNAVERRREPAGVRG